MPFAFLQARCITQGRARDGAQIPEFLWRDSPSHLPQVVLHLPLQPWASQRRSNCHLLPWEKQLGVGKGKNLSPGCPFKCMCQHHVSPGLPCIQAGCTLAQYFTVVLRSRSFGVSAESLTAIISSYWWFFHTPD